MPESAAGIDRWRSSLAKIQEELHAHSESNHPLLWAVGSAIESAEYLLRAYEHQLLRADDSESCREAILEAVGSSRAAVGAVTFAAFEHHGGPRLKRI
jgi:hypothetical protein